MMLLMMMLLMYFPKHYILHTLLMWQYSDMESFLTKKGGAYGALVRLAPFPKKPDSSYFSIYYVSQ